MPVDGSLAPSTPPFGGRPLLTAHPPLPPAAAPRETITTATKRRESEMLPLKLKCRYASLVCLPKGGSAGGGGAGYAHVKAAAVSDLPELRYCYY